MNLFYSPTLLTACAIASSAPLTLDAQRLADFEDFGLAVDTFRNGAALDGDAFAAGPLSLPNTYTNDGQFESWTGWSISNRADTTTPGFGNQYSAFAGSGAEGSETFAVGFGSARIDVVDGPAPIEQLYVTNTTYAALSMRDGDQFAKRFGGAGGDDPDFLTVTFVGWSDSVSTADSVTVFLADFRPEDSADDYILDEWLPVDLSVLGAVDSVTLAFASSDVGQFGINTPTYVAIDQVSVGAASGVWGQAPEPGPAVWPNPVTERLRVSVDEASEYAIANASGQVVTRGRTGGEVSVSHLPPGVYGIRVSAKGAWTGASRFVRLAPGR